MRTGTNLYSRIMCSKLSSMKPHRCQKTLNHRMRVAAQHRHSTGDRSPNFKTVILPDKQQITILRHYANVIFENGTKTAHYFFHTVRHFLHTFYIAILPVLGQSHVLPLLLLFFFILFVVGIIAASQLVPILYPLRSVDDYS